MGIFNSLRIGVHLLVFSYFNIVNAQLTVSDYDAWESEVEKVYDNMMAAFSSDPATCLATKSAGTETIINTFTADCSTTIFNGNCVVVITRAVAPTKVPHLGVYFRYPNNLKDFADNIPTKVKLQLSGYDTTNTWGLIGYDYIFAFKALLSAGLSDYMYELWSTDCDKVVYSVGHSAGAALAEIFGLWLVKTDLWKREGIYVYSFGTPRVGNQMFSANVFNAVYMPYRIVFLNDTISQYPPTTCNRTTQPSTTQFNPCFSHFGFTFWYNAWTSPTTFNVQKCSICEDPACDDNGKDPAQHYAYFGYDLSNYDSGVCKP